MINAGMIFGILAAFCLIAPIACGVLTICKVLLSD